MKLSQQFNKFIRPNDFKDTTWLQNMKLLSRRFYLMNMLLTLPTLIAIFLIDRTLGKAFDSQCNNEDIFWKDLRGMHSAKEMLSSNWENFYMNPWKTETNDISTFDRFSVSVPNDIPAITTSSFKQLMSQWWLHHLLIFGLATISCPSTLILSPLLQLQNRLTSQQLRQRRWKVFWIQWQMQQVSFCFATKTTQKLWLQVSCCLLIRTTQ